MATGIGLFYVGCVLLLNGIGMLQGFDKKATSIMNFFTGGLYVVIQIICLCNAVFSNADISAYYGVATSMLFGFTYLFVGITSVFDLDARPQAWYCFFVGLNTIPCSIIAIRDGDIRFGIIWLIWGYLWLLYWITGAFQNLKVWRFVVPISTLLVGIFTCWIPGFLMLANLW